MPENVIAIPKCTEHVIIIHHSQKVHKKSLIIINLAAFPASAVTPQFPDLKISFK